MKNESKINNYSLNSQKSIYNTNVCNSSFSIKHQIPLFPSIVNKSPLIEKKTIANKNLSQFLNLNSDFSQKNPIDNINITNEEICPSSKENNKRFIPVYISPVKKTPIKIDYLQFETNFFNDYNNNNNINNNNNFINQTTLGKINSFLFFPTEFKMKEINDDFETFYSKNSKNYNNNNNYINSNYSNKEILSNQKNIVNNIKNFIPNSYKDFMKKYSNFSSSKKKLNNNNNITNVTNNFFIQFNNHDNNNNLSANSTILKKKRGRHPLNSPKPHSKKIKKKDKTTQKFQLNQIEINGHSISKFPVISLNDDELSVELLIRMLNEANYFNVVDKYYSNSPIIDEEKYNKPSLLKVFKKELDKLKNLYLIDENVNEFNPINLIKNFYKQIKNCIVQIQKNFVGKKKNSLNIEQCNKLELLIHSCNAITDIITDYKKTGIKKKSKNNNNNNNFSSENFNNNLSFCNENNNFISQNSNNNTNNNNIFINTNYNNILISPFKLKNKTFKTTTKKIKHFKTYLCEFCNKAYSNGQGLGGHMSRIHPNQSYKYKDKIRIRNERVGKRKRLIEIKRKLFNKYGLDFDSLLNKKEKIEIQQFLLIHKDEYRNLKKQVKKNEDVLISPKINKIINVNNDNNNSVVNSNKIAKDIFINTVTTLKTDVSNEKDNNNNNINNDLLKKPASFNSEKKIIFPDIKGIFTLKKNNKDNDANNINNDNNFINNINIIKKEENFLNDKNNKSFLNQNIFKN